MHDIVMITTRLRKNASAKIINILCFIFFNQPIIKKNRGRGSLYPSRFWRFNLMMCVVVDMYLINFNHSIHQSNNKSRMWLSLSILFCHKAAYNQNNWCLLSIYSLCVVEFIDESRSSFQLNIRCFKAFREFYDRRPI